ncbi:MAG TPA: nucleotide exchange factor GrpE [Acidiferrobacteraceae bacterium]|nr:nucleotide exchange factor GrpE [Acidiferrobacteraceae bacterium]
MSMNNEQEQVDESANQSSPSDSDQSSGQPPDKDVETEAQETVDVGELQDKLSEAEDRFIRAKAEIENTRRRAEIDVANAHKYAIERFATEVLAVKDSLELAKTVDLVQDNKVAVEKMFEGVDLTLKLLGTIFEKFSVQELNPQAGEKFDPERHQAMSMLESDEVAPNRVVSVMQKGYLLNERLLRPAMVMVAKAKTDAKSQEDEDEGAKNA